MTVYPYVDPATGVFLNRLGITDEARLAAVEADFTFAVLIDLGTRDLPGQYDLDHLRGFHVEIFGDLYPWAGEIRTVGIAKTDPFCLPQHIETYSADVFGALRAERYLRNLPRASFLDRITHYLAEINALHPFREGNGRTQRAFVHQLSRQAGWPVNWSNLDRDENTEASVAALRGDNGPLRELLDQLVAR